MQLQLLGGSFAVCRLGASEPVPNWAAGPFISITRTSDELSVVCEETSVPEAIPAERGWRCFRVAGPLDFKLVGVLASLLNPLAIAGISVFAISTFDTDYLLVKKHNLEAAASLLGNAGHSVT